MDAGKVEVLLILGGNPVATAPADLQFGERLAKVGFRAHLGLYDDETALLCHWHVPEAHYLESWGDVRASDGTVSIIQPLIAPLYDGKTAHEVLAAAAGREQTPYDLVREYWRTQPGAADFERWWRTALHDGLVAGTALPAKAVALRADWVEAAMRHARRPSTRRRVSSWCSASIRACSTAASPTTAGSRKCRSPSPSSPGTTPRS